MEDLQKIKEFFSKPIKETTFKKGDKVTYLGHPGEITGINKEMTGAITYNVAYDKGNGRTKVTNLSNKGGEIKLAEAEEKYTVAGHSVTLNKGTKSDGTDWTVTFKNGKSKPLADVLALIKPMPKGITMNEAKEETGVDMAKKQLDALGVKYEMSKTDKVRPFKVIYQPINKSDEFYNKFEDIVDLFNLKGVVKSSMNENFPGPGEVVDAKYLNNAMLDYFNRMNIKLLINTKTEKGIKGGVGTMYGDLVFNGDDIKLKDIVSVEIIESSISEAKKEDAIDTITMDVPLFLRILEYSREDAQKDIDLHDVTDKAISLGKERGILSMEDYEEIVGDTEEIKELKGKYMPQDKLEALDLWISDMLKYKKPEEVKQIILSKLKANLEDNTEELSEAYVPSNIRDFAKRKGVSSLVNKVAGWAEKVGARIAGGTAVGKNYSTLVLDLDYKQQGEIRIDTDEETIELYDEPVYDFKSFQRVYIDGADNNLEEAKNTSLDSKTIQQIKDDIKGFPKYQKRGFESFKKEVRERYKITPKQLEDILHGELTEGMNGQLDEPFFIEVSVRDARKALDLFQDRYRNSNIDMYGSNVYAADTPEDIYDLYYDLMSQDIEVLDYNVEDEDFDYDFEYEKTLRETIKFIKESKPEATTEEVIAELKEIKELGQQLNEELCPAGKAYIKRRQAAGEKSSAYLSGRGVKVCKGQMSGRKKKK
jgi:hypothetical protein